MTHFGNLKRAAIALALFVPTIGHSQAFERIETAEAFDTHVVGKTLRWPTGETIILADGTTRGTMQNVGDYHGSWHWQDGYYCRSLIVDGVESDPKCLQVEQAGNRLRMSYDKGAGRALELSISAE